LLDDVTATPAVRLFDEFDRTDESKPRVSEDAYSYLNRLAGEEGFRIRSMLEDWFAQYDANAKEKVRLRTAFIDKKQDAHLGAWWELYTYSLYRRLGYSIEVHPKLDGVDTAPDFLVTRDAESMYVECTVVSALDGPVTKRPAIEAAICDAIKEIANDDFLIGIRFTTVGNETPSTAKIKTDIDAWAKGLDYSEARVDVETARATGEPGAPLEENFAFRDWVLTAIAFPLRADERSEGQEWLGALPSNSKLDFSKIIKIIRRAVADKGGKYLNGGSLDKPLIVAVMSINRIASVDDAVDAMFGSRTPDQGRRDAYWRGPDSPGGARGTQASAVLFSHDMQPWSLESHLPIALLNPWADKPINDHPPLPTITTTDGIQFVETKPTKTPQGVFGLGPGA